MSSPYGPQGGQDPNQQWGQQPQYPGATPQPGYDQHQQYGQQPPQQPQYGQQQQQWGQQPGQPQSGGFPAQQPGYDPNGQQQFGQPQPGYGGYPQAPYGAPAPKKSKAGLFIALGVGVVVAIVLVLGFVAPGFLNKKVFDANALDSGVKGVLTNSYKIDSVTAVNCPAGQEVKQNATFTCDVTVDGTPKKVIVTVQDSSGTYAVGQPG